MSYLVESREEKLVAPVRHNHLIKLSDVHRAFSAEGRVVHALKAINLDVREGEFLSLVGQSGCGKSTLLNLMAGLDSVSHGSVRFNGEEIVKPRPSQIGYVFQQPVLLPWRRIIDNVLLPSELMGRKTKAVTSHAYDLLKLVGLSDFTDCYPSQLSGGMQQRAAIARALVHEPSVLLMDEPFGALDAITREHMNVELIKIWERTRITVVFVTHDLHEAAFLSDRIAVMTARPGTIREIIVSDIPRPRDTETVFTDGFQNLTHRLSKLLS